MKRQIVYIGNGSKNGIYCYYFQKGKLQEEYCTNDFERCTYLCHNKFYLYSVQELQKKQGYVIIYKKCNEKLNFIEKISSYGKGPCHIELDDLKKLLFVSNYQDGFLTIFKLNYYGVNAKKIYSSVESETESHLHCVKISLDKKCFFVTDLGKDLLVAYNIEDNKVKEVSRIEFPKGTEPRHIANTKKELYIISEKSCKIYTIRFKNNTMKIVDKTSILPYNEKKKDNYTGCAIKISKNSKNIYVTIRGHNSISVYKRNVNGKIKLIQNIYCNGKTPRDVELDKTEKYLLVANQDSNNISMFKRNKLNGKLKLIGEKEAEAPTCIKIN